MKQQASIYDLRFEDTEFMVQASSFEQFMLWQENENNPKLKWIEDKHGFSRIIGYCAKQPVNISFSFCQLEYRGVKHRICFYDGISQVVDWKKIGKWLDANIDITWDNGTRKAHCDAWNFHHVLHHCIGKVEA